MLERIMQNSEGSAGCCNSVCCACELIPPALLQAIPQEFKRIKFEDLKDGKDYSQNFIVGKVFQAFPISKRAKGYFRKLLLTEAAEKQDEEKTEKKLNMFILNENEKQLDSINQKSFVAVSGFKVENLTCKSGDGGSILPVQVLVVVQTDSSDSTMIWIATSVASPLDDSTSSLCQNLDDESMEYDEPQPGSDNESMVSDDLQQQQHITRPVAPVSADHQHSPLQEEEDFYALVKEYSQHDKSLTDESDEIDIESDESLSLQTAAKSSINQDDVDEQANPVPESSGRCYTYTQLSELKESITTDQNFNIYGIVVSCYFKPSSPDRDKILELVLRDSTVDFFRCRVIGRCADKFPDVYPGDIIRIHRMLVDKFRDKLKGKCFSPKFIVVFDGKSNDVNPRCVAKTFVYTQDDKKMVQNLRLLAKKKQDIKLISEIKMGDFVTVICQEAKVANSDLKLHDFHVCHLLYAGDRVLSPERESYLQSLLSRMNDVVSVCMVRNESVLLKVWDGTSSTILQDDRTKTYLCGKIDERLFGVAKNYLVPVWINGDYTIAAAEVKPGQYVKVCDVHLYAPKSKPDEPRLCIHPQTKSGRGIELLNPNDDLVQELKRRIKHSKQHKIRNLLLEYFQNYRTPLSKAPKCFDNGVMVIPKVLKHRLQKIWGEAGIAEEITMDATPSFMKDIDTSNVDCGSKNDSVPLDNAASQVIDAAVLASQQSLISTLNQGIEPASSMQLTSGSPPPANDQLSLQKNVERTTVEEGLFSPSVSRNLSPVKERGKRGNTDSNIDNASKKMKMDDDGQDAAVSAEPTRSVSKNSASNPSGTVSENGSPDQLNSPADIVSHLAINSSPFSSHGSQPNWWKSVETVSVTVGHQNIEPTYLDSVVKHFVPYKFRLFVTVLHVEPQADSVIKLIRLYCPKCHYLSEDGKPDLEVYQIRNKIPLYLCAACSSDDVEGSECVKQVLEYTFVTSFTLSDGTSTIEAYMWKKNAATFFKGMKPEDVLSDSSKADAINQMLWDICPNCCPFESTNRTSSFASNNKNGSYYPVLDCCIMSYTAAGKTRYQIFDTRLK